MFHMRDPAAAASRSTPSILRARSFARAAVSGPWPWIAAT
jgi:hypothetical protein